MLQIAVCLALWLLLAALFLPLILILGRALESSKELQNQMLLIWLPVAIYVSFEWVANLVIVLVP